MYNHYEIFPGLYYFPAAQACFGWVFIYLFRHYIHFCLTKNIFNAFLSMRLAVGAATCGPHSAELQYCCLCSGPGHGLADEPTLTALINSLKTKLK
jgi:hypothetical protein